MKSHYSICLEIQVVNTCSSSCFSPHAALGSLPSSACLLGFPEIPRCSVSSLTSELAVKYSELTLAKTMLRAWVLWTRTLGVAEGRKQIGITIQSLGDLSSLGASATKQWPVKRLVTFQVSSNLRHQLSKETSGLYVLISKDTNGC